MIKWILLFVVAISLSAFAEDPVEVSSVREIQGEYVVDPIVDNFRISCPRGTQAINKYCWDRVKNVYNKCGVICKKIGDERSGH
ncbi:hypothetical protein ACES2I_11680 [Bdellovibrio bacteriovorus]|uniref:hypothetical protein n=1 Tax=Bdellovibrio bacteriovorus TaxID=959 RepID=UPI0035A6669C